MTRSAFHFCGPYHGENGSDAGRRKYIKMTSPNNKSSTNRMLLSAPSSRRVPAQPGWAHCRPRYKKLLPKGTNLSIANHRLRPIFLSRITSSTTPAIISTSPIYLITGLPGPKTDKTKTTAAIITTRAKKYRSRSTPGCPRSTPNSPITLLYQRSRLDLNKKVRTASVGARIPCSSPRVSKGDIDPPRHRYSCRILSPESDNQNSPSVTPWAGVSERDEDNSPA